MKQKWLILVITTVLANPAVFAENVYIPVGQQGDSSGENLPRQGALKAEVRRTLGNPIRETPAVGDPPISSWEYEDFKVIFEYDHVVHAVKKHRPQHPEDID